MRGLKNELMRGSTGGGLKLSGHGSIGSFWQALSLSAADKIYDNKKGLSGPFFIAGVFLTSRFFCSIF